jgi:serine/threonine protein kinase/regulation of enolase protein 1 (concanavalin A-like superfamily)
MAERSVAKPLDISSSGDLTMPAGEEGKGAGAEPARLIREREAIRQAPDLYPGSSRPGAVDPSTPARIEGLDEFARALVEIGAVDKADLDSFAATGGGVADLARALVEAGKLTPYQAAAVYQKKGRALLIGNYLVLDKLGRGGMGVVFKARHRQTGCVGALKLLPPSFAREPGAVLRFRREVEAAGMLDHPNLVAALDANDDRGVHYLVMEYVEGHNLDHIVDTHGPMRVDQAVECVIQAACGLEAAHARGIIHRDIKPGNLMLDAAGTIRVLDLGLARIVDAVNPFSKTEGNRLTQSGLYMGTIDYMAPEQAEDSHRVDHRVDIYSLGCTLYYLLTGQEPFWGETVLKRIMAHMNQPAPSLRILRPDVAPALDAVYLKMMAKRPGDRPASMSEVIDLLEASKTAVVVDERIGGVPNGTRSEPMVFNEHHLKRAGAPRTKTNPSIFARPRTSAGLAINPDLSFSDLVMDYRPSPPPAPVLPAPRPADDEARPLRRLEAPRSRRRPNLQGLVLIVALASAALGVTLLGIEWFSALLPRDDAPPRPSRNAPVTRNDRPVATPPAQPPPSEVAVNVPDPAPVRPAAPPPRPAEVRAPVPDRKTGPTAAVSGTEIAGWGTMVDPDGDCLINADGGALVISVPGTLHDLNASIGLYNAPRVVREIAGDFDIQVKVVGDFTPGNLSNRQGGFPFNGAGIVVSSDGDRFIRLERGATFRQGNFNAFAIFEQHESGSGVANRNGPLSPGTAYLRLARRGSRFLGFTSMDGRRWTQLEPIDTGWPARVKVGLNAINSGNARFAVRFEELSVKAGNVGGARR